MAKILNIHSIIENIFKIKIPKLILLFEIFDTP